jgi:hypothetical protein
MTYKELSMQKRSISVVLILGLITLGIYPLYWLISTRKELIQRGAHIPPVILLIAPYIFMAVIAMVQLVVTIMFALNSPADGTPTSLGPPGFEALTIWLAVLAFIAVIPISLYWMYRYCQAADQVTKGRVTVSFSYPLSIVLAIFSVSFVWSAIMQNAYNQTP